MMKFKETYIKFTLSILVSVFSLNASGQAYSGYTPYSIYGVGDKSMPGTAYNRSMAGVGIAGRNNHYINVLNPAAVTARDSLSFMMDFSLFSNNKLFVQDSGDSRLRSVNNTFNIGDCVMSFPLYRSSAMMIGITPYSSVGYNYSIYDTDKAVLADLGRVKYTNSGQGCIYQGFVGAGATFWKKFSVGAELIYYFGNIEKSAIQDISSSGVNEVNETYDIHISALSGKFGLQFEQKLGKKSKLCLGATYLLNTRLLGTADYARIATGSAEDFVMEAKSDTLDMKGNDIRFAGEFGVGLSFVSDRWRFEVDYTRSDWNNNGFNTIDAFANNNSELPFDTSLEQSVRVGAEFIPNRNDIRYYMKRCAYRAGAYWSDEYFTVGGHKITAFGITLGATFPVFRWYNGITVAVDLGKRGSLAGGLIRENYVNVSLGVNLFDIWFQKYRYE